MHADSSVAAVIYARLVLYLFPFVFTIMFSNFVVSILVDTYLGKRRQAGDESAWPGEVSFLQVRAILT